MGTYIVRRLIVAVPTLLAITFLVFLFLALVPGGGGPVDTLIGPEAPGGEGGGIDLRFAAAYLAWLARAIQGNFGFVAVGGFEILSYLRGAVLASAALLGTALAIGICTGIPLGMLSAMHQNSKLDVFATIVTLLGISIPSFLLALAGLWFLGLQLRLVPIGGMQSAGEPFNLADFLRHLALPAAILGAGYAAVLTRYSRAAVLEVLGTHYVTAAEGKGLPRRVVLGRHALRNAMIPVLTVIGLSLPDLVGGAVIIETVFAWPGMGLVMYEAVQRRDYQVLMAGTLLVGVVVLAANLATDLLTAAADPRIRY